MSVKVTAMKDLKLQAQVNDSEGDRVFNLHKNDQLDVLSITDVCNTWESLGKRKVPLPRRRDEIRLVGDLLKITLNRS